MTTQIFMRILYPKQLCNIQLFFLDNMMKRPLPFPGKSTSKLFQECIEVRRITCANFVRKLVIRINSDLQDALGVRLIIQLGNISHVLLTVLAVHRTAMRPPSHPN